jgi:hypothetical protein
MRIDVASRDYTLQEFNTPPHSPAPLRVATQNRWKFSGVAYFSRHDPHKETKGETQDIRVCLALSS